LLDTWKRLKFMLESEQLDPQSINRRFSPQCKEAANRHFADLVPPRMGEVSESKSFYWTEPSFPLAEVQIELNTSLLHPDQRASDSG
jgi:hypothetical protein